MVRYTTRIKFLAPLPGNLCLFIIHLVYFFFTNFVSTGAVLQYMSDEDQKERLDKIKQYLVTASANRKTQTIDNPLFQRSIHSEPVGVP